MARQWEGTTSSAAVTGGQKVIVTCKCPPRCDLEKLIIKQTAGTLVAFTADVFSSLQKATDYVGGTDDFNRVVPQQNSDAVGKMQKFFDTATMGHYENKDGGPSNKQYKIYVVIAPSGVQAGLTFDVTVGVRHAADVD